MKYLLFLMLIPGFFLSCNSQNESRSDIIVGGPCEGCEAIYEYGDKELKSTDTLTGFDHFDPKLKIGGTVFKRDGKTPASDVILYIYHTDRNGIYATSGDEEGWGKKHGMYRGWVKTGADGKFTFYTFRPESYPKTSIPQHIHITVKEPDKNEYYIEDYFFDDDPFLTVAQRNRLKNRGGSGIVQPQRIDDILTIERDIILGLNIPNYQ